VTKDGTMVVAAGAQVSQALMRSCTTSKKLSVCESQYLFFDGFVRQTLMDYVDQKGASKRSM